MHAKISISILTPWYRIQIVLLPDITFLSWFSKLINPILQQYQYDRNYGKFNCCLEIQSKLTAIISICTLNPLKLPSNQIISDDNRQPHFYQYQSYKRKGKFTCCLENHWKKAGIISICSLSSFKEVQNQIHIWCWFLIVAR